LRRLWQALPEQYHTGTWYFTDEWEAYGQVLPPGAHRPRPKGSGHTSIVEAINCSLRQKCAVLVRKTCSLTRSLAMHHVRIQLGIDEHNRRLTPT
jgi:IS1 family transposase